MAPLLDGVGVAHTAHAVDDAAQRQQGEPRVVQYLMEDVGRQARVRYGVPGGAFCLNRCIVDQLCHAGWVDEDGAAARNPEKKVLRVLWLSHCPNIFTHILLIVRA